MGCARPPGGGCLTAIVLVGVLALSLGKAGPNPDELAAAIPLAEVALAARWVRTGQALEAQDFTDLAVEAFLIAVTLEGPAAHRRLQRIASLWNLLCCWRAAAEGFSRRRRAPTGSDQSQHLIHTIF